MVINQSGEGKTKERRMTHTLHIQEEYMSLAMLLMAVAGLGVAFALGLTMYRNGRRKEKENRPVIVPTN